MKQLGLGASVVKKLVETVGRCDPTFVFTDRYFTGFKLADFDTIAEASRILTLLFNFFCVRLYRQEGK